MIIMVYFNHDLLISPLWLGTNMLDYGLFLWKSHNSHDK